MKELDPSKVKEKLDLLKIKEKADLKAWAYLRKLLNDDEKYFKLRRKKEPIELNGSCGGRYFLYPSGHVVDLRKEEPVIGHALKSSEMPYPDVLATIAAWIMHDEKRFKENWGCGNIHVRNNREIASENDFGERRAFMRAMGTGTVRRHRDSVTTLAKIALMIAVVPTIIIVVMPSLSNLNLAPLSTNSTATASTPDNSTFSTAFANIVGSTNIAVTVLILLMPIVLIGALLSFFADRY